jgi:phage shock protein A
MNDLLKKLNTLARAKLSDLTPNLPSFERSPNLERQVNELRQRINEALAHEDQLQAMAQGLRDEVARLDALADDAVAQGRDADARYLLEQLKRAEQRLSFAEADLRAHQRSAEELIRNVNMLEASVADVKATQQNPPAPAPASTQPSTAQTSSTPEESQSPAERYAAPAREKAQEQAEKTQTAVERVSGMLREAQDKTQAKIEALGEMLNAGVGKTEPGTAPEAMSDNSVMMPRPKKTDEDDDLAQRLRRLSKPE